VESALKSPREDESQAHLWNLHGWCLQHLGSAREAFKSYEKAFEMSGNKDPWYRKGMANVLMTSDQEKAKEHFTEILKEQKYQSGTSIIVERPSGNVSTVGLLGWCNYRLGQYDEAIRLLESALARSSDNVTVQFDLALAFLASGRTRLALDAYTQGHKITQNCETSRQRGLYYIALFDLVDARRLEVVGAESEKILEEMKGWLSVAGMASENFTWLAQSNNFEISVSESHPGFNH
jgi:tetratricopeptide (TPR) repeat protein